MFHNFVEICNAVLYFYMVVGFGSYLFESIQKWWKDHGK